MKFADVLKYVMPFISKKRFAQFLEFMILKIPASAHGFIAKIKFEKYTVSPKIYAKMCPNSGRKNKSVKFLTFGIYLMTQCTIS